MANQYFPLLPKLKENSAVTPDKISIWEDETYDFLDSLIKSLAVSGDIKDIGTIDSIPDVWARPLLFEMALFDKQNTNERQFIQGLHERVVNEWRCIMAMLALNDIKHLNLKVEEVQVKGGEGAGSIERILKELAPNKAISPDSRWDTLYIIFYQGIPLAMTSPTTLVVSASDYTNRFGGRLPQPWSSKGVFLTDPVPYLMKSDLEALFSWLSKLRGNLNNHPGIQKDDNDAYLQTMACLDDYCRAIERQYQGQPALLSRFRSGSLKINKGIFRYLDVTVQAKEASAADSQVRVIPSAGRNPGKDLLLVSPAMLRDAAAVWGVPVTQFLVWQGLTANDISEADLAGEHNQLHGVLLKNTEFRRPEEFFTEYMTVVEPENAFPGSLHIRGEELLAEDNLTPIIPLKPEILEYFTVPDIDDRLTIEDNGDEYLVHFAFPLSGTGAYPVDYDFVKTYPKKDLIYLQKNMPVIEIWPNFRREGWQKYYLYYENAEAQNKSREIGSDIFYVAPWSYGTTASPDVPENGMSNQYTALLKAFPEVLLCTVNCSTQGSVRSLTAQTGMLLLRQPETVEANDLSKWQIGIDFGTSSTMIYYKDNNYHPKPLAFASHLFQVTDSGTARNFTYLNFIPSITDQEDGSFLSIFHQLNTKKNNDKLLPLQDGHVFPLQVENSDKFLELGARVDANLKWRDGGAGGNTRYKATSYLEQICIQSEVEAALQGAAQLNWEFSYPAAFSDEERESFRKMCNQALADACADTCFDSSAKRVDTQLESVAAALHFNKLNNSDTNFGDGAICLDIGAGTTDVSVISGRPGKIVYHTSLRFAGRYLFAPIYHKYQEFFAADLQLEDATPAQRTAILDADMRSHSDQYLEKMANLTGDEKVKKMLEQSQAAMAGIFYYLGAILAKLHASGIYTEDHVPDIYVGGNGSRVFYWLTGGGIFDSSSIRMRVLRRMILASSGMEDNYRFDIHLSDKPKIEVACGMLEEKPRHELFDEEGIDQRLFGDTEDEYILSSVIAGEGFRVGDQEKGKEEFLSARDIAAGLEIQGLPELDNFIHEFNESKKSIWLNGIQLDESAKDEIKKRVSGYYVAEKGKNVKEIHVEPVFISALKKLMEMLINGR